MSSMDIKLDFVRRLLSVGVVVVLVGAASWAQSLGEVARRNRAQKRTRPKATRVYTNNDLPRAGGLTTTGTEANSEVQPGETLVQPAEPFEARPDQRLAPYVPSPQMLVERMLQLAEVGPFDTVYDMGSGDGRILIMAAQKFGADAVGVELDEALYKKSLARVNELKLQDKVRVIHGDMLQVDLSPATVVTLYLLPSANVKLRPRMEKELKKGSWVVCHDFEVPGWEPYQVQNVIEDQNNRRHVLYLYQR